MKTTFEEVLAERNYKQDIFVGNSLLSDFLPKSLTYKYQLVLKWNEGDEVGYIWLTSDDFTSDIRTIENKINIPVTKEVFETVVEGYKEVGFTDEIFKAYGKILEIKFLQWFVS